MREQLSPARRALVRQLKADLESYLLKPGLTYREIVTIFQFFRSHADLSVTAADRLARY